MTTSSRSTIALSAAAVAALVAVIALPQAFGGHVSAAFGALADARRPWLAAGLAGFGLAFGCTVGAWRAALTSAGGRICPRQAAARLGVGSLVNSFAPAKLGDAVKIALFAKAIDAPGRLWTAGGVYAALAAARSLTLAALLVVAFATGAMPLWPVFMLLGGVGALAVVAALSSRLRNHPRIAQLAAGLAALERSPRALLTVLGWTAGMQITRLAGTAAVATALGLPHPLLAALVILPALDVAAAVPITPGSIGVGSAAVAAVLASRGIGMTDALGVGFAIQAVETMVSLAVGTTGLAYLLRPNERARRIALRVATVGGSAALAAGLGIFVLDLL